MSVHKRKSQRQRGSKRLIALFKLRVRVTVLPAYIYRGIQGATGCYSHRVLGSIAERRISEKTNLGCYAVVFLVNCPDILNGVKGDYNLLEGNLYKLFLNNIHPLCECGKEDKSVF